MLKIVIIADPIDTQYAGIHVYTRNLINALECSGKFNVICMRIKNDDNLAAKNQVIVPPVFPFFIKDPFRLFLKLPREIRKLNPDMVIEPAHFGPFNLPKKIKRVTVIHDLTPVLHPEWHTLISSVLQRLFLPFILKKASLVITNSNHTSKDLLEYYPVTKGKTAMIYPPVDPFFNTTKRNEPIYKRPFFLNVGTIEPRKNLELLLDAYKSFREKSNSNHQLIFCGRKGWKSNHFYKKLKNHPFRDDIILKGFVSKDELRLLYNSASAFIYPSLYEGFGFPVAEAMACGTPCIVSNQTSLPEVGGDAVHYFNPYVTDELVNHLISVATSPERAATLGNSGKVRALIFSEKQFSKDLEKILEQIN